MDTFNGVKNRIFHLLWFGFSGALAVSSLLGCSSDPIEPPEGLVPAFIAGFEDDDPQLELSVAGLTVSFEIVTYGNSCRSRGETRVVEVVESHRITLSPLDRMTTGTNCLDYLQTFHHSGSVKLSEPGVWTMVLSGEESSGTPVEFEFELEAGS